MSEIIDYPVNTMITKSTPSFMKDIQLQSVQNYKAFITGIPTAFVLIPLSIFILSPDEEKGIFLFGSIFTIIFGLIFTSLTQNGNNFLETYPSLHGLSIGYLVGYFIMDHINYSRPGSLLSALVFGIILSIIIIISLFDSRSIKQKFFHVGIGFLIGNFLGIFFGYLNYKNKHQIKNMKN